MRVTQTGAMLIVSVVGVLGAAGCSSEPGARSTGGTGEGSQGAGHEAHPLIDTHSKLGAQGGGFSASCIDETFSYPWGPYGVYVEFSAICKTEGGAYQNAGTIHLDWILSNINGSLLWWTGSYGGYNDSCNTCYGLEIGEAYVYYCNCYTAYGSIQQAAVNMNDCIANYNGNLAYICG